MRVENGCHDLLELDYKSPGIKTDVGCFSKCTDQRQDPGYAGIQ